MTSEGIEPDEQSAQKDENVLEKNKVRYEERRRLQLDHDILSRERQLDIEFGGWGVRPGLRRVGKIYALAIQTHGGTLFPERDRLVVIDAHPFFLSPWRPMWVQFTESRSPRVAAYRPTMFSWIWRRLIKFASGGIFIANDDAIQMARHSSGNA